MIGPKAKISTLGFVNASPLFRLRPLQKASQSSVTTSINLWNIDFNYTLPNCPEQDTT